MISAEPAHLLDDVVWRLSAFAPADGTDEARVEIVADPAPDESLPAPAGRRRRLFEEAHALDYYPEAGLLRLVDVGVAAHCEAKTGTARILVRDADERAVHLGSHLFLSLCLFEILRARGRYPVHAAGVALDDRAVVLAGASGSGKSTLALACVRAGWAFLGDDVLLLRDEDRGAAVRAFPDEIDLTDESIRFFPELAREIRPMPSRPWEKRHIRPVDVERLSVASQARPAALVFPTPAVGAARLSDMSPDEALIELIPNVVRTDTSIAQRHLDALAALARITPAYRLEIADPLAAPVLLAPLAGAAAGKQ